ncbi:hypothetical protein IWW55_002224 [Coemansia sp. RSA 2706]|nr:hypothetical protein LPJ63_004037 [Coemansia sp. RSA 2711]KAJ1843567.1 hypothetical protein LPJ70_003336 [Coemansia sp. RSA 2708]KAJ2304865.1 hypothetical protein IWW55_002224 [Coemansia sp. RSA 2706]KAJ2312634.1 hypothetical protein IWW54_001978 [Coemansia sp. RSA 2705]KAJ2317159.1 hypothetical protein IWW52_003272 [Coemansia sp. RSA 2704]KAJ2327058.1 hypothetical protein IWW51_001951 [Coemansia sp. RSA 2702]
MKLLCAYPISLLAAIAAAKLQITLPNTHTEWQGGNMESIKWKAIGGNLNGRLSIELLEGSDSSNLNTVATIAENIPASSLQSYWNVPHSLKPSKNYALKVVDEDGEEYYGQSFKIGSVKDDGEKKSSKNAASKNEVPARNARPEIADDNKVSGPQSHSSASGESSVAAEANPANKPAKSSPPGSSMVDSKAMHKDMHSANAAAGSSSSIVTAAVACAVAAAGAIAI